MMQSDDLAIRKLILRAIADDYEEFNRVVQDVKGWAAERGIAVQRQFILALLDGLVRDGYAQAYMLSAVPTASAQAVAFNASHVDDHWFYVTPKGAQLVREFQEEWRCKCGDRRK